MKEKNIRRYLLWFLCFFFLLVIIFNRVRLWPVQQKYGFEAAMNQQIIKSPEEGSSQEAAEEDIFNRLLPLFEYKKSPGPYDWLAQHHEPGQTYADFIKQNHAKPTPGQNVIYVALLGDFDETREKIINQTIRFMHYYYQVPVKKIDPIPLESIPAHARRVHPEWQDKQILSTYIIDKVLKERKPGDAYCLIAFTSSDLWPGAGWNFVFGQASIEDRVGVWSIYRNGDPNDSEQAYRLCLMRTIKTGVHEVGHMFGLHHCIYFECMLNGSNHRKESDERPVWLCPICLKKIHSAVPFDVVDRYRQLHTLCHEFGLKDEEKLYKKALNFIGNLDEGK